MRTRLNVGVVAGLFLLACVATAQAQDAKPANVAGNWKWQVQGRQGGNPRDVVLKLKQDGAKVTGTMSGFQGQETEIQEGKVKGNTLTFNVTREFNNNKITTAYEGKVEGDTIKGTITSPGRNGGEPRKRDWEAKREKEKA